MPEQFGRYTLVKHIASGGMAEIWLALQPGPGGTMKPLVIKRILPHNVEHPEFLSMFLDEARIASGLNHQNVAQIHDVGEVEGRYFIAMEYVHGVDVRTLYRRLGELQRPLPIEVALYLVASICSGLHYAHEKKDLSGKPIGIVHRDVSPQNVLLDFGGAVKLIDFGIAKAQNKLGSTRSGVIKGKTAYLSPEQARGEELDARSDVFAAGVILYELTVGRRPFEAENDYGTVLKIASCDFKAPRAVRHSYPSSLERVTLKAMAPNRDARYGSARQLEEAIRSWGHDNRLKLEPLALSALLHETFPERARTDVADEIAVSTEGGLLALPLLGGTPGSGQQRAPGDERTPGAVSRTGTGTADRAVVRRRWLVPLVAGLGLAAVGGVALYAVSAMPGTDDPRPARVAASDRGKGGGGGGGGGSGGGGGAVGGAGAGAKSAGGDGDGDGDGDSDGDGTRAADKDVESGGAGKGDARDGVKKSARDPVDVAFESTPAGAEVFDKSGGTEALGKTPFTLALPAGDEPWRFEFRMAGYSPYYTEVLIEKARKVEATLVAMTAAPATAAAAGKPRPHPPAAGVPAVKPHPTTATAKPGTGTAPTPGSRIVDPFK
ncbi:MAG TPA: serine/threonine-protein kinase [Myxococcota bacterium]|jgi:serine/threonine protein kinase|nr:serine/threonine-protein kinase [Myxococcota bacterium]